MQVPKHLNAAMVAELEEEYGSTRPQREAYAKSLMYKEGAKGSMVVGMSGIAAHFLAEKYCAYRAALHHSRITNPLVLRLGKSVAKHHAYLQYLYTERVTSKERYS